MVYIDSLGINRVVASLKIWKREKKSASSQSLIQNSSVVDETIPGPVVESHTDVAEGSDLQETFKEHYPLLLPFSYAAIVEDERTNCDI